ncbi:MAG: hypothetical protein WC852_05440 [Candidatus Nanoarchaeia archaeon]|jgi:uncharacterized protein (UPF0332 family)
MASEAELYTIRAEDEFLLAEKDMLISTDAKVKAELGIPIGKTFFYSVISHAYYSIFYCAKAYLFSKGIKTSPPEEHKKTFDAFKKFVDIGVLDAELLKIYEDAVIKADSLLDIFKLEKKKRGMFTYNLKSEANIPYAKESIENAKKFVANVKALI